MVSNVKTQTTSTHKMGAWVSHPECGVPVYHLMGEPNASAIVRACAATNAVWVAAATLAGSLLLLIMSLVWKRQVKSDDGRVRAQSVVPLWAAVIPVGVGMLYAAVAVPLATARMSVAKYKHRTSGMPKSEWLNYEAGNRRTVGQVLGVLGAAGIASASVLGIH